MKRIISCFIAMAMIAALSVPAFAGQENADNLETVILKVRGKIDVPQSYDEFISNMRTDEYGVTHWSMQWSQKNEEESWNTSYISVEVTSDGFIESYNKYGGDERYSEYVKIPAVQKDKADELVKSFISKVCPEIENELEWEEPNINSGIYSYSFSRKVNGIPMPSNRASFSLNGTTGEITSYYASWNTNLDFPSPENKIPLEEAQKIFKENMPLDLEYNIDKDGRVYLQYTRSREKGSMYINAITGEVEKPEYYYGIYQNGIRYAEDEAMKSAMGAALRPEEQKQVDNIAGLITAQEAEKKLRLVKELDFDEKYKLTSSNLYQSTDLRSNETKYYINLYFTHMDNTEDLSEEKINLKIAAGEGDGYASATLNAKTGELISFSSNIWGIPRPMSKAEDTADEKQTKAKREQAKKTADAFVSKMQPEKVNKVKFMDDGSSDNFTFNYARMENGAYFIYDSINVSVNKENMKISQYNCNWTDVNEIPPTDGAIGLDKAHEILFGSEALALEYIINEKDKKAVLAYRLSDDNPWLIDAKTGMLLDWSGKQYVKEKAPEYSDIAGHFCEEAVKQLAIVGVFLKGDRFEPDIEILQKDYVILLSKLGRYYYYESDNIDDIYSRFIKEGIMDKAEKNPDGTVSREDAVKYLLRYLGFKKFAEIPGIFNCDFSDADEIAPELAGYAAIAKGLGIVKGSEGKFMPKEALTKAEAAVLIYNCLKADF